MRVAVLLVISLGSHYTVRDGCLEHGNAGGMLLHTIGVDVGAYRQRDTVAARWIASSS
jgi:hypothetical protein